MKKTVALALSIVLVLISLSCFAQAEEGPKFVTIQEWLDTKGECGDCMLLVKIVQILNPVVALAADETGTVNLYSGGNDPFAWIRMHTLSMRNEIAPLYPSDHAGKLETSEIMAIYPECVEMDRLDNSRYRTI